MNFTETFGRHAYTGQTITVDVGNYTVTATIHRDDSAESPWDRECGHGDVTEWTRRDKQPGERVLSEDRSSKRFYDFKGAVTKARDEGWGVPGMTSETHTAGQIAAAAAEADFNNLRAWCDNEWEYVGIILSVSVETPNGVTVELTDHAASLWGLECGHPGGDNGYLDDVANELLDEALDVAVVIHMDLKAA